MIHLLSYLHRRLPWLTLGVAVLGLLVSNGLVWWADVPKQPGSPTALETKLSKSVWTPKLLGAVAVTIPVLVCALYVIVAPVYGEADKKWAYGAVGTLLGFWLGVT
jgi:uncharacterized iron-regulated membrane protein